MRFFYDSATETEESEAERQHGGHGLPNDVKGKGRARDISKSASPSRRSHSVRISVPPVSSTRSMRDTGDRSRLRASTSSDSSLSDEDEDDDDDESDLDSDEGSDSGASYSGSDSEEDEFPVNPTSAELAKRRRLSQYPAQADPLESYLAKQQKKAWQQAQASHNRDLAALRSIRLNAFAQASEESKKLQAEQLELTTLLLADMNMKRQKQEEEIDREFQNRNKARWNDINRAISELEKAEKEQAIAIMKKQQEEAELKAKAMREAELKKIEQEKAEQKKIDEEKQLQERALQEQKAKAEQAANERARKEKEETEKAAAKTATGASTSAATVPSSSAGSALLESKGEFERWHAKIKELKQTVLPAVSNNKELKNACWKVKRSISTRISNVAASATDIKDTSNAINELLQGAKTANENAYLWSLNLLSKKITEMAGNNSEPDLSPVTFALAQIVIALLLADHKAFGEILMARLVKRCPYIVPFFPSRGSLSPAEHSKLLARKEGEPPISYKQRMSGIISLYAAIVQTSPSTVPQLTSNPSIVNIPSYFRPEGGWRWLALVVRPPLPLLDVTALLLRTFLRMVSERFHTLFGKQYIKLLRAIAEQAIDQQKIKWNDSVQGDISKIRIMIGEWMEKGQIQGAEGRIPT